MRRALAGMVKHWLVYRRHRHNQARRIALGQARGLDPALWGATVCPRGDLVIGGCQVAALAREYGTPLMLVDRSRLEADYRRFSDAFRALHPGVEIAFSYKTNPVPGVIAALHEFGALAEVISHFELWLALRLGVPPARILFNGPGKGRAAIDLAVGRGVKLINVDSLEEIDAVADAARQAGRRQPVGVRVTTSVGWSSQFGLSIRSGEAFEAFRRLARRPELHATGLHLHLDTGIRDVHTYRRAVRELMAFARALRSLLGLSISFYDLGGGFGVPTVQSFDTWDYRLMRHGRPPAPIDPAAAPAPPEYARAIIETVREFHPRTAPEQPTLVLEPGRALTSSAQSLILKVLTVKPRPSGSPAVILDGGKNLAFPIGYEHHELLPVAGVRRACTRAYDFFGPLCHPGDRLFTGKPFPSTQAGDLVAIMDAGAYFVPNQMNFSHTRPPVVIADGGTATGVRARESFDDLVMRDRFDRALLRPLAAVAGHTGAARP